MKAEQYKNKILLGDAADILRKLPDESVDCVMTSPPYWALRDYNSMPTIWGDDKDCNHEWKIERTARPNASGGHNSIKLQARKGRVNFQESVDYKDRATYSNYCEKCNAWKGVLGQEPNPDQYIKNLCAIFDEVKRALKETGTCWVNMGDTYGTGSGSGVRTGKQATNRGTQYNRGWQEKGKAGVKGMEKCLLQIPARFAIAMCERGWILRNEIVWHKPNAMPQSVKDRFTADFEKLFFFVKSRNYSFEKQYDPYTKPLNRWGGTQLDAAGKSKWDEGTGQKNYRDRSMRPNIAGRNKRCVWSINTRPQKDAHFATFPPALVETPIRAGCPEGGIVLDPFIGSGTTAAVARSLGRSFVGIELNPTYVAIANKRLGRASGGNPNGVLAASIPSAVDRRLTDKKILKKN